MKQRPRPPAPAVLVALLLLGAGAAYGQQPAPVEDLLITAASAFTWSDGDTLIVQLDGPLAIEMDHRRLSARGAVIWLTPVREQVLQQQQAQIALLGDARMVQDGATRSGTNLLVSAPVRGAVRITAEQRVSRDLSAGELYQSAKTLRAGHEAAPRPRISLPASMPSTGPTALLRSAPAQFKFLQTMKTEDGKIAAVLSGGVALAFHDPTGAMLEFQGERAVLFTNLSSFTEGAAGQFHRIQDAAEAIYLEGDARIIYTPPGGQLGEQRLTAQHAYYELATDRAIMSDVLLHTIAPAPQRQLPIFIRAATVRQLAKGEYSAEQIKLTTSGFATPSVAIAADYAYARQEAPSDTAGSQVSFQARDATLRFWDAPAFYFPYAGGTVTEGAGPLRAIAPGHSRRFGTFLRTQWGLLETLGRAPSREFDAAYRLDYYSDRGPATGLDADYAGGFVTETDREPWNFNGDLRSFVVLDHGTDEFAGDRRNVEPLHELRGRAHWEHQYFFPGNWQIQMRAAYVSDPTFLEEWFPQEWRTNQAQDLTGYVKHQEENWALTLLGRSQPNNFVTTSDLAQEQFEVQRLPELGYHLIGQSFGDDSFTLISDNSGSALRFNRSGFSLAQQGYGPGLSPGLPSLGIEGAAAAPKVPEQTIYRGDLRQEVDYPLSIDQFRVVPYFVGRYIPYSDTPRFSTGGAITNGGGGAGRFFAATGIRATTAFWAVDDGVQSDVFDLHRLRHVIEPQFNAFTSGQSVDRSNLFIYDEDVDAINDISAVQMQLRQRWQTQRGGPGRWHSVDFLTINVESNNFFNRPPDRELNPLAFRGLFFPSEPESSIPRNGINADSTLRLSDTAAVLSDVQYNVSQSTVATASVGMAFRHDPRVSWYVGTRYIQPLNSDIITFAASYELSRKYTLLLSQSYDLKETDNVGSNISVIRRFDAFAVTVYTNYNPRDEREPVFGFTLVPAGFDQRGGSNTLGDVFGSAYR